MHLQFPIYYIDDEGSNQHPSLSFYIHQRTCLLKNWHNLYVYTWFWKCALFTKFCMLNCFFTRKGDILTKRPRLNQSSFCAHCQP